MSNENKGTEKEEEEKSEIERNGVLFGYYYLKDEYIRVYIFPAYYLTLFSVFLSLSFFLSSKFVVTFSHFIFFPRSIDRSIDLNWFSKHNQNKNWNNYGGKSLSLIHI